MLTPWDSVFESQQHGLSCQSCHEAPFVFLSYHLKYVISTTLLWIWPDQGIGVGEGGITPNKVWVLQTQSTDGGLGSHSRNHPNLNVFEAKSYNKTKNCLKKNRRGVYIRPIRAPFGSGPEEPTIMVSHDFVIVRNPFKFLNLNFNFTTLYEDCAYLQGRRRIALLRGIFTPGKVAQLGGGGGGWTLICIFSFLKSPVI